jgi:predicted Zn-dependent protease
MVLAEVPPCRYPRQAQSKEDREAMEWATQKKHFGRGGCRHADRLIRSALLLAVAGIVTGCGTVPVGERRQVLLIPEAREIEWGRDLYVQVVAGHPVSNQPAMIQMVQRVGRRIARVTERPEFEWEFRVIGSSEPSAFCLPGGKVGVYEGILPICQNEAGLATVLAHQIGHSLARHGGERISRHYLLDTIATSPRILPNRWAQWRNERLVAAYGLAWRSDEILPFSQQHEAEADRIGLLLMARAGYDPSEAPRFWRRLTAAYADADAPALLVHHPSYAHRVSSMADWLSEAIGVYAQAPAQHGVGQSIGGALVHQSTREETPDASRIVRSRSW